jgi:hypothetical protein
MTYQKQDILEDFYEGNAKEIGVTVWEPDETEPEGRKLKNLENCEITWVLMNRTDYDIVYLRKSSFNGDGEIKVTGLGTCEIYINPPDTYNIHGKFRHHVNVVDEYGYEETVLTGLVEIHETSAKRYRQVSQPVYLIGTL